MSTPGVFDAAWSQKYRPTDLKDFICDDETLKFIERILESKSFNNFTLCGIKGCGKTTLAKLIVNGIPCQYLWLNASDENGIDIVRDKIKTFAETKALIGKIKVVVLDEADGLSNDAQKALRGLTEEYNGHCRFILTANFKHKIIPQLESRCPFITISPPEEKILKRICYILKKEGVEYADNIDDIIDLIGIHYPDIRIVINTIQNSIENKKIALKVSIDGVSGLVSQAMATLNTDVYACRKLFIKNESMFNRDYVSVLKEFFNQVYDLPPSVGKSMALVTIAEHMYRATTAIDQEINFFACLVSIQMSLNENPAK